MKILPYLFVILALAFIAIAVILFAPSCEPSQPTATPTLTKPAPVTPTATLIQSPTPIPTKVQPTEVVFTPEPPPTEAPQPSATIVPYPIETDPPYPEPVQANPCTRSRRAIRPSSRSPRGGSRRRARPSGSGPAAGRRPGVASETSATASGAAQLDQRARELGVQVVAVEDHAAAQAPLDQERADHVRLAAPEARRGVERAGSASRSRCRRG